MESKKCIACGYSHTVVAAPMLSQKDAYIIYRQDGDEVKFFIVEGVIKRPSMYLRKSELNFIKNHLTKNYYGE